MYYTSDDIPEITLATLPLRIQDVQARIRLGPFSVIVRTR